jgi:hypothetical protein
VNDSGLPANRRLWRYAVTLDTEGGDKKEFLSILLTERDAKSECNQLISDGHKTARVIVDKDAALAYQLECDEKRSIRKGTSH